MIDAPNYIKVWSFYDAPQEFRELSRNGGDEDWLALVPPKLVDDYIPWLDSSAFGCCCVDDYDHSDFPGYKIVIGAHA